MVRIRYDGKYSYVFVGDSCDKEEFIKLCESPGKKKASKLRMWSRFFDMVVSNILSVLEKGEGFSLASLQCHVMGADTSTKENVHTLWRRLIENKRLTGRLKTAACYEQALNRFEKDMGTKVGNSKMSRELIEEWVKKMEVNLSPTTIGIYLRTFRIVVKMGARDGLWSREKGEAFMQLPAINKKRDRKDEYLDVITMKYFYDLYVSISQRREAGRVTRSLGLFLFLYLGNGMNLADMVRLEYNDCYFRSKGKLLRFTRHKTMHESSNKIDITIPIIPELRLLMDRLCLPPRRGGLLFDIITHKTPEEKVIAIVHQLNKVIRKDMRSICYNHDMDVQPSTTWCRHSYATNLRDAGVSIEYISSMMGHTMTRGSLTTLHYLSDYNEETMFRNNALLLSSESK